MMANTQRQISFIAAAVSCRRTFIGPLIRGTGAIPVERAQDISRRGEGKVIRIAHNKVIGENTNFSEIRAG